MTSPVPSQRDHDELIRRCEGIIAEWDERFKAHEKLRTKASETLLVLTGLRLKSLVLSQRDALAALGRERDEAVKDEQGGRRAAMWAAQEADDMEKQRDEARVAAQLWRTEAWMLTRGALLYKMPMLPWETSVSVPAPKGETTHG